MNKDPAFLFYPSDFLVGTSLMSYEQIGKYIKLLCIAHSKGGYLTERDMFKICETSDFEILEKFNLDDEGIYYNERLLSEITKRKKYSDSRSNNRKGKTEEKEQDMSNICKSYDEHMENENININNNTSLSFDLSIKDNKYKDIVNYLNEKSGKNFRVSTQTKKLIDARLHENFLLDDFYRVIDNQCDKWLNDPKMNDYLRPQTLFGTKFESYLNTVKKKKFNIMDL